MIMWGRWNRGLLGGIPMVSLRYQAKLCNCLETVTVLSPLLLRPSYPILYLLLGNRSLRVVSVVVQLLIPHVLHNTAQQQRITEHFTRTLVRQ